MKNTPIQSLDTFTRAYIECALWSSTEYAYGVCPCCGRKAVLSRFPEPEYEEEPVCDAEGCGTREIPNPDPMDKNYSAEDIAPETLERMIADCKAFQEKAVIAPHFKEGGHDFWLTRNDHGAGFWDGDWPDSGDDLTEIAHSFGQCDLYAGDDGKLYLS